MSDIRRWLEEHGLEKYTELFVENEIDLDVLGDMTMDELKELDIPIGARKRILKAAANGTELGLSEESPSSEPPITSGGEAERRQPTVMFCYVKSPAKTGAYV